MERRRKLYHSNADVPIPKTTAWRQRKGDSIAPPASPKRRKIYNRTVACPVPSSTLWKWKSNDTEGPDDEQQDVWSDDELGSGESGRDAGGIPDGDNNGDEVGDDSGDIERRYRDMTEIDNENGEGYNSTHGEVDGMNIDGSDGEASDHDGSHDDSDGDGLGNDDGLGSDSESCGGDQDDVDQDDVDEENEGSCEPGNEVGADRVNVSSIQQPLYTDATISLEESTYTTYHFAIKNKLSYQATSQLLELMRIHLPAPNLYPSSLHALKKHLFVMKNLEITHFCSTCLDEIPLIQKHCNSCVDSGLSYYALLPFEDHIADLYAGTKVTTVIQIYCSRHPCMLLSRVKWGLNEVPVDVRWGKFLPLATAICMVKEL